MMLFFESMCITCDVMAFLQLRPLRYRLLCVSVLAVFAFGCSAFAQTSETVELTGPETRNVADVANDTSRLASPIEPARKRDSLDAEVLRLDVRDNHIVAFSSTGSIAVTVVDMNGGEHAQKSDSRGQLALDVHNLPSGRYYVTAVSDGRRRLLTLTR